MNKITIEGIEYDLSNINAQSKQLIDDVKNVNSLILQSQNMEAILTKAKRAYIADLKREMLSAKSGVDFLED